MKVAKIVVLTSTILSLLLLLSLSERQEWVGRTESRTCLTNSEEIKFLSRMQIHSNTISRADMQKIFTGLAKCIG